MHAGLIPLVILLLPAAYACGLWKLRRRARGRLRRVPIALFAAGWAVLAGALLSPLHEMSEQLFSAHMVQHELLMAVAAPLLVLARPTAVLLWGLPRQARRAVGRAMRSRASRAAWSLATRPFDAWLLHGIVIWVWHIPSLFQATLTNEWVHAAQHISFFGSGVLFWWSIVHARRSAQGLAVMYLFTTAVHTGVLGALMAFARTPWYPAYAGGAERWGLTLMSDQQLAGLVMWIPASFVYLVAALWIMARWLRDSECTVVEGERIAVVGH